MDGVVGYDEWMSSNPAGIGAIGLSGVYGGCGCLVSNTKQEITAISAKHWVKGCFDGAIVCL